MKHLSCVAALVALELAMPVEGAARQCTAEGGSIRPDGILLCTHSTTLPLSAVAGRAAPILWFSPDEQLLDAGLPGSHTPGRFDFDLDPSNDPVVYFDFYAVYGDDPVQERGVADLSRVESFVIDYVFYYKRDYGLGSHRHDLEYVRLTLRVEEAACGRALRLIRAEGAAHGSEWYHNVLDLTFDETLDTSFPLTVLVEEGKHASSPDRNGDGHYTPRYDVNRRVSEAWGVRDTLRSGDIATPKYDAASTKPRRPAHRVGPRTLPDECLYASYRLRDSDGRPLPPSVRYELRPAPSYVECRAVIDGRFDLCKTMADREIGVPPYTGRDPGDPFIRILGPNRPLTGYSDALSIGYRRDGAVNAMTVAYPLISLEIPRVGGWLVPKVSLASFDWCGWTCREWIRRRSFDVLYLPSVSRWADWYASVGRLSLVDEPDRTEFEIGARFRFMLGDQFVGFQLGLRWSGFNEVRQQRMVFETSLGVW